MKSLKTILCAGVACMAFMPLAHAETVTTQTVVTQKELPKVNEVNFSAFDINGDGILSMAEVGEKLFYVFDTDGNEVIDNIEFDNPKVMTIIPMQKEVYTFVDSDNDGATEEMSYTYETFIQQSGLMRFDEDKDGLSPADFLGKSILEVDTDKSKTIELDEWKKSYIATRAPLAADQDFYND